jgi:hypothetical protein
MTNTRETMMNFNIEEEIHNSVWRINRDLKVVTQKYVSELMEAKAALLAVLATLKTGGC